jgi:hypothetical protein
MNALPDGDPSRPREEFVASTIRFLGEQDGPPERELKSHLATLLADERAVHRAYLARLQYGNSTTWDVALCLAATNPDIKALNDRVGRLFAAIFRRDAYLDILFLSKIQEAELSNVCPPFYRAC